MAREPLRKRRTEREVPTGMKFRTSTDRKREQDKRIRSRLTEIENGNSIRQVLRQEGKSENSINAILRQWLSLGKITQEEYDANTRDESSRSGNRLAESGMDSELPFEPGVFLSQGTRKAKLPLD